jgi:hypothetical protein
VVYVDLRQQEAEWADLSALLIGPSGNLRAPTLRRGRTLMVGFDEQTYAKILK